jgi:ribonuclease P protein component
MNTKNTFPKKEHLCGEIRINRLFTEGKAFIAYPLRVMYSINKIPSTEAVKTMVTVPKKRFKRAVKRNRIKRLMRESYRLNKHSLYELCNEHNISLQIAFGYVSDTEADFVEIQEKMRKALARIETKIKEKVLLSSISSENQAEQQE